MQFGVGFYSSFLVADRVMVQTKSPEEGTQWMWEAAAGSHQFTIKEDPGAPLARGTRSDQQHGERMGKGVGYCSSVCGR